MGDGSCGPTLNHERLPASDGSATLVFWKDWVTLNSSACRNGTLHIGLSELLFQPVHL